MGEMKEIKKTKKRDNMHQALNAAKGASNAW